MARQFDLIAFDWDGTLFDSTAAIALSIQDAVRDVGGTVPSLADAKYVIGMSLQSALRHAAPDVPEDQMVALTNRYRLHFLKRQEQVTLFDGVLELLDQLTASGHLLAIATGKNRRGLDRVLDTTLLKGRFHATRTSDETAGKPHPLMLQELMAELDVAPERLLMVGDTTHDLQMAVNAGCASVGVSYGAHHHAGFEAFKPLYVAHTVAELQQWMADHA